MNTKMAHGSGTAPRRHETANRFPDTEWEAKEALRQRELEEARARAAQMEKTMRWWSDCTANWREKWSKVRNERNKAREEAKLLRTQLDNSMKDMNTYKREKQELEVQNEQMRKELEKIHLLLLKHAGQWDHQLLEALESVEADVEKDVQASVESISSGIAEEDKTSVEKDSGIEEYVLQGAVPKHAVELDADGDADSAQCDECGSSVSAVVEKERTQTSTSLINDGLSTPPPDDEMLRQNLSMLQLRLDEATKTLLAEREEKTCLHRSLERLEGELNELREKCEDLKLSKQEAVRDLLQLQDQHQDTVATIQADLMDEANSREGMDRRLADLRAQLERLQAENASEWGKRERLETEKLALERENKKLRGEIRDAQERLERKGRPGLNADTELRQLQQEASDKNKEIGELKHSYSKVKKALADKTTELAHAVRRAEQYESEVKRLRSRVEELKRELAVAEDDVDTATNNNRTRIAEVLDKKMILLQSTDFMRKFINLLRYDGANSSLSFILFTITEFLVLSNILLVFLNETDNVEKCVLAAKDFVTLAYLYTSMYKRFQQPQAGIRLTETIEEEYLIDCYRLDYNEQNWRDIKQHYENNRSHLEQTGRLFNILTISCMAGITTRYAIFDLAKLFFGGRSMRGKPTPFVAYIPPDVDQTDFLVYIFVLQVFLTAILHMEGYFINCALFQCSQKILTNFEAMYIIIDHIAENYPSSSSLDFYDKNIEQARNNGFFNTDNSRTEKLREDMRLLVRSHQHLNRSVKSCVKCFEYGILALSVLISMDTCSLFYFMLQAESNIIVMSYLLLCSTYTTLLLLVYYIGQRVTNQNDLFRRGLAKLQWIGKPIWFKRTLLIMMIKANTDIEIKPYSLYVLNLTSYKDVSLIICTSSNFSIV